MGEIDGLIERVKKASGPLDYQTVAEIIAAVHGKTVDHIGIATGDDGAPELEIYFTAGYSDHLFVVYHERPDLFIDAALALVAKVLPEWRLAGLSAHIVPDEHWVAQLRWWEKGSFAKAATAPLAILLALLSAHSQKAPQ